VTRYIGEPSPEKKIMEGRALTESLARRPAPEVVAAAGGATTAALLTDLAGTSMSIAADTWTWVTPGDGTRYFTESWRTLNGGFSVFYDGQNSFTHNDFALYVVYGSVTFSNAVNGDFLGVAIEFSASSAQFYSNVIKVVGLANRPTVTATWWGTLSDVRLHCYASAARTINAAQFVVRKFELNSSGEIGAR